MSYSFGLTIESLVAILLLLTIIYCARLNSRLEKLRSDEGTMKRTVAELVAATETAERAIAGLRATVRECQETLDPRLKDAEGYTAEMASHIKAGEDVLMRLRKIATARGMLMSTDETEAEAESEYAAAVERHTPSDTRAMVAAAQAFAQRARSRAGGFAA